MQKGCRAAQQGARRPAAARTISEDRLHHLVLNFSIRVPCIVVIIIRGSTSSTLIKVELPDHSAVGQRLLQLLHSRISRCSWGWPSKVEPQLGMHTPVACSAAQAAPLISNPAGQEGCDPPPFARGLCHPAPSASANKIGSGKPAAAGGAPAPAVPAAFC